MTSLKRLFCLISFCNFCSVFAAPLVGIIGGQGSAPYAALVEQDGSVRKLDELPPTGLTYRVGMNHSGEGIVGGTDGLDAYAALVAPDGTLTPVEGLMAPGEIYTVAINKSGEGIIGGGHLISNTPFVAVPYAALISPGGIAASLSVPPSGLIYGVAIDSSGDGIIGGIGPVNSAYAALVSPNGTVTPITGLPTSGAIFWVSENDSKLSFIGGQDGSNVYAAFVNPNGSLTPIGGLPPGQNYSVALNSKGSAIMGGTSLNLPYAALVTPEGSVTTLNDLPTTPGVIYNVTINKSGTGLIAGFSAAGPFGSFVAPNGTLTPLKGLPAGSGFLDGAAIHSTGIALVGGTSHGTPFAAFAAPDGTLTYLTGLPATGEINSTAIASLDRLVPKSIGPFDSWANTQFAFSNALTQHCMIEKVYPRQCGCFEGKTSSVWASVFGNYVHENARNHSPSFSNDIVGAVAGFDCGRQDLVLGGGLAYAFNDVRYSKGIGHTRIHQESAVVYASLNKCRFYLNLALWGGLFQTSHRRDSFLSITSKSNTTGWNLTPHIEMSSPFSVSQVVVDPFIALDWANNWQNRSREHGSSGFNIELGNHYLAVLRSEIGIRLFETLHYGWGCLVIEEKGSYVNRTPTYRKKGNAAFIGADSGFEVVTINPSSLNLGVVQLHIECIPSSLNVYGSIDYQGEFGSSFQSHLLTLSIEKEF